MVREYLTDLGDQDGPGNTSQITHPVGADSSVFGPDFDDSEGLLEVFGLFPSQLEDHKIVFSADQGGPALFVLDGAEKVCGYIFFNVSGYCFCL